MYSEVIAFPVSIVRGGTSKGIFIMENQLPRDTVERDKIILAIFGSPDIRQIDGIAGADILTSKLAIIGPSTHPEADVDYTFGQVSMTQALVDYKGNCGNISAAVGVFAIYKGLIRAEEPITKIRIHMVNTGRILQAYVPVLGGVARVEGEYRIAGVPGTGAKLDIDWADCGGATMGALLPTGNVIDVVQIGDKSYPISIVDAGNITVFVAADDLGLKGTELPQQIEANQDLMRLIEEIRGNVAQKLGLVAYWQQAAEKIPYAPFVSIISQAIDYYTIDGQKVMADHIDVVSRLIFMQGVHKAHPVTGTVALGAAARIPGSVVQRYLSITHDPTTEIRIGHPSGIITISSEVNEHEQGLVLTRSMVSRTARMLLDGVVYVRKHLL